MTMAASKGNGMEAEEGESGMASDEKLMETLQAAIAGLQWMSESDYPFTVCHWQQQNNSKAEAFTSAKLLQFTEHPEGTPVETMAPEAFFAVNTQVQDWQSQEERAIAARYQTLLETLKHYLSDLTVYRVGEVEIDVYIIGKTQAGTFAGLATKVVET